MGKLIVTAFYNTITCNAESCLLFVKMLLVNSFIEPEK